MVDFSVVFFPHFGINKVEPPPLLLHSLVEGRDAPLGGDSSEAQDDVDAEEDGDAVVAV